MDRAVGEIRQHAGGKVKTSTRWSPDSGRHRRGAGGACGALAAVVLTAAATSCKKRGRQHADNDGSERFHDPPPAFREALENRGVQSSSDFCSRGSAPFSIVIVVGPRG